MFHVFHQNERHALCPNFGRLGGEPLTRHGCEAKMHPHGVQLLSRALGSYGRSSSQARGQPTHAGRVIRRQDYGDQLHPVTSSHLSAP